MISALPVSGSKSASESLGQVAEFYIKNSYYGLHMIKVLNQPDPKIPDSFDAIAVFAVPLNDVKKAALITEKITHSIVILLNTESGYGVMVEYSNNNKTGIVQVAPGILAKQQYSHVRNPYGQYSSLSNGFYKCKFAFYQLEMFNRWFTSISNYHYVAHNCQVYHRSLIATALTGHFMYNYRAKKSMINQLWSSHEWFDGKTHTIKLRSEIKPNMIRTITLRELVEKFKISCTTINNVAIEYDSCCHTVIEPKNMDIVFVNDCQQMELQIREAISSANNEELLKLLKDCYRDRMVTAAIGEAFDALFAIDNHFVIADDVELLFLLHNLNNLQNDVFLQYLIDLKSFISAISLLTSAEPMSRKRAQELVLKVYRSDSKANEFAQQKKIMNKVFSKLVHSMKSRVRLCSSVPAEVNIPIDDLYCFIYEMLRLPNPIFCESLMRYFVYDFIEPDLLVPFMKYSKHLNNLFGRIEVDTKLTAAINGVLCAMHMVTFLAEPQLARIILLAMSEKQISAVRRKELPEMMHRMRRSYNLELTAVYLFHLLIENVIETNAINESKSTVQFLQYVNILPKTGEMEEKSTLEANDEIDNSQRDTLLEEFLLILRQPNHYCLSTVQAVAHVVAELSFLLSTSCDTSLLCGILVHVTRAVKAASESMLQCTSTFNNCEMVVLFKESVSGYTKESSWKLYVTKLYGDYDIFLGPRTDSEFIVNEKCIRNKIQHFIILKSLFKVIYKMIHSPSSEDNSELFSRIHEEDLLFSNEDHNDASVEGSTFNMTSQQFLDASIITFTTERSSVSENASIWSRNLLVGSVKTEKVYAQMTPVLFVHDPTQLLLIVQEDIDFKVFLSHPLIFTDAETDAADKSEVRFTIRYWTALPQLPLEPYTDNFMWDYEKSVKGFHKPNIHSIGTFCVKMDSKRSAAYVVEFVRSKSEELHAQKLTRLTEVLTAWASDTPESVLIEKY